MCRERLICRSAPVHRPPVKNSVSTELHLTIRVGRGVGRASRHLKFRLSPRFAYFFATEKVGRRPQAAKLSARWRAGSSRPTKKRSIIVPSSAPFGGTFPQWGGLEERQNTQRVRWLGKPRRGSGTAPAAVFANPGPSGPAGI